MHRNALVKFGMALLLTFGAVSCTKYGSRTVQVSIDTSPERATVYAVPYQAWLNNGSSRMLQDADMMEKYRLGISPITDQLVKDRRYVLVAEKNGSYDRIERTVTKTQTAFVIEIVE
jgi:hypothetical protein